MTSNNDKATIDYKAVLTSVLASAIVSGATFAWFMGGLDNRVKNLEGSSTKIDVLVDKVNAISQNLAVLTTDISYVKDNVKDLKANSTTLGNDVRDLRQTVNMIQTQENKNDRK